MGISRGKKIVTDGLIFYIDAANPKSYVSDSTTCSNLRSDTIEGTLINGTAFSTDNNGVFDFDNLADAVEKVNNNIDTGCNAADALIGLDIYGVAHYFDRFGDGSCVIRKGDK